MARHFLGLYLLLVFTLATSSWTQDQFQQSYASADTADDRLLLLAVADLRQRLHGLPPADWRRGTAAMARESGMDMELFDKTDIVGRETLERVGRGTIAHMQASGGESWAMKEFDHDHLLALKSTDPYHRRGAIEWSITLVFYAVFAFVIMIWLWPLTRDLRSLEQAVARFGDRNWRFSAPISRRSQIHPLAETFRKMAERIDGLIASHRDMSNAFSHEIKTPLSRMKFEIELAQRAASLGDVKERLEHIGTDVSAINDLVTATLNYAILERADLTLNIGTHDFSALIPAIAATVGRDARPEILLSTDIRDATRVSCDAYLMESAIRNLLYNAMRFANRRVRVTVRCGDGVNRLLVEDDGPGIPEAERNRVFESFVQLRRTGQNKTGFGLGLAIVKRAIEWHGGEVGVTSSAWGGARISASWPEPPGAR